MKLFVPGRFCLFGEHTDWAGGYRRINPNLPKGYAIITGTNLGIYATEKPHPTHFIFYSSHSDGSRKDSIKLPMEREALLAEAQKGSFFLVRACCINAEAIPDKAFKHFFT